MGIKLNQRTIVTYCDIFDQEEIIQLTNKLNKNIEKM